MKKYNYNVKLSDGRETNVKAAHVGGAYDAAAKVFGFKNRNEVWANNLQFEYAPCVVLCYDEGITLTCDQITAARDIARDSTSVFDAWQNVNKLDRETSKAIKAQCRFEQGLYE